MGAMGVALDRPSLPLAISTGTLPYVEQGDASGVPVLLLHGYADSWRFLKPLLCHLQAAQPNRRVSTRSGRLQLSPSQ